MSVFQLSNTVNKNKLFLVGKSQIEKRLDPFYYIPELLELEEKVTKSKPHTLLHYAKSVSSGATPKTSESEKYYTDKENGIPFLRVQNLSPTGKLNYNNPKFINEETHNGMLARSKVKGGDLLIKITGVGRMAVSSVAPEDFEGNVNQHMVVMKTDSPETSRVLAAYLNSDIGEKLASRRATGGTRPALDYPALLSIPVIYDNRILDITKAAVKKKEAKEQQAKDLLVSIDTYLLGKLGIKFSKHENGLDSRMFTTYFSKISGSRFDPKYIYKMGRLSQQRMNYPLVELKHLLATPPQYGANEEAINGVPEVDYRYIRITDINDWGTLKEDSFKTAPIVEEKYVLKHNDIIIARSGATVGKSFIYKSEYGKALFAGYMIRFEINPSQANPDYIFEILNCSLFKLWIDAIQRPAGQPNINAEEYKTFNIPTPPLEKQNEIADHIRQIRDKAKQLQQEGDNELTKASREVETLILNHER